MARIGNRQFTTRELGSIFDALDRGATRQDVRGLVTRLQGRGIGNDSIRDVRSTYVRLRRAQGFDKHVRGRSVLPARESLPVSARPRPPVIPGIDLRVTLPFDTIYGARVGVFPVNESAPSLTQQLAEASDKQYGSPIAPNRGVPTGGPLRVRTPPELTSSLPRRNP
ncbi:hypothetical protein [Candidatus Poriferisocius sp.]|uniref:hypothetical protein n=1 Tax=Candidatus Poriferisocius sp. TaxID=3101276 RepID=UPI003B52AEE4